MNRWYYIALLIIAGFVFPALTATAHYTSFNYNRDNGFLGNKVYCIYQDRQGYIWMATENGLVAFNGYEFKTYTTKDGLPDNEVLTINEDRAGRLWLTMFCNEVCYLWKGKVYNRNNDSLLSKLSFKALPTEIHFDRWNNIWISVNHSHVVFINAKKEIKLINQNNWDRNSPFMQLATSDDGVPVLISNRDVYRYNKDHLKLIGRLPGYAPLSNGCILRAVNELTWTPFEEFVKRFANDQGLYWKMEELPAINFFGKLSPGLVGMGTIHGAFLKDIKTGMLVDSFLGQYDVSACMIAKDGSLWFGTLGGGVFHFSRSFVRSVSNNKNTGAVRFIKAEQNGLRFIEGRNTLVEVQLNAHKQPVVVNRRNIAGSGTKDVCSYITNDRQNNWIVCTRLVTKHLKINGQLVKQHTLACKAVLEEGDTNLVLGTTIGVFRLNKDEFVANVLYNNRVTSLAKIDSTIYAGTLTGLVAVYPGKKPSYLLKQNPSLNSHITALCSDDSKQLWVANSKAVVTGIYYEQIIASINEDKGLVCNSISTLIADSNFLWVGTDNGLFVFNRKPPFNIIRRLFNCITAIRQYYNKGNTEKANKFVDDFSSLIRTTFEMATQTFTPLEKELAYLRQYLEIEKERFSHSFGFSISKKIQSPDQSIFVPTMLLQPFVENAVRHGVRHLPDGEGKISISVVEEGENIIITIQDNGIGRLKTLQMKQTSFTAAPVTSTKVNKKRVDILNKLFEQKITMKTEDILNDKNEIAGTIVTISYPVDMHISM